MCAWGGEEGGGGGPEGPLACGRRQLAAGLRCRLRLPEQCCSLTWLADLLQDGGKGALLLQGHLFVDELESDPRIGCRLNQLVADVLLSFLLFLSSLFW